MSRPPSPVRVRPVRPGEYRRAGQIVLAAYDDAGTIEGPYRSRIADIAERVGAGSEVWVAVAGERVLGCVTFTDAGDPNFEDNGAGDCGFRMLGVAPTAQGLGVGRTLVRACVDEATARGRHRMAIYSLRWMTAAHGLYAAEGFVRRPDRDVRFPAGIGWAFQKDLTEAAAERFPPAGPPVEDPPWYEDVFAPSR